MSIRYADVLAHATAGLTALGYGGLANPLTDGPRRTMPKFDPGPPNAARQKTTPNGMVFLMVSGGAGLSKEQVFDRPFIVVRVVGPQNDYDSAERLAYDLDSVLDIPSNGLLGSAPVLYVTRTAGAPQLVDYDATNRYHFQTTYLAEAQR